MTSTWYYHRAGGQQMGPFPWAELRALAKAGAFTADDYVWNPDLPDWVSAGQIPGLAEADPTSTGLSLARTLPASTISTTSLPEMPGPDLFAPVSGDQAVLPGTEPYPAAASRPTMRPSPGAPPGGRTAPPQSTRQSRTAPPQSTKRSRTAPRERGPGVPGPAPRPAATTRPRLIPIVAVLAIVGAVLAGVFGATRAIEETTTPTTAPVFGPPAAATAPFDLEWQRILPADGLPAGRSGHSTVYDPVGGKLIVVAGVDETTDYDDTWAFDPVSGVWTEVDPPGVKPSPRAFHAMVYVPTTAKAVLFGGWTGTLDLSETWIYDPATATWEITRPAGETPSGRDSHALACDATTGKVVLFGGWDIDGAALGDTWIYDPVADSWTESTFAGPSPSARASCSMAYDPTTGKVLLFGGCDEDADFDDTWAFDAATGTWTNLRPAGEVPSARDSHAMACDPASGKMVLFGGWDENASSLGDTWEYDPVANEWTELSIAGDIPSARIFHSLTSGSDGARLLLVGGSASGSMLNDVWAFDPEAGTWSLLAAPSEIPAARVAHAMVYATGSAEVVLFGGSNSDGMKLDDTWTFDSAAGVWTEIQPTGSAPTARDGSAMVYVPLDGRVLLFGGYDGRYVLNDTWAYDPTSDVWTDLNPRGRLPESRDGHTMAYDPTSGKVILFGGSGSEVTPLNDTWAYDPATNTWTEIRPSGESPPPRLYHSMVFDAGLGGIVMFGGSVGYGGPQEVKTGSPDATSAQLLRYEVSSPVLSEGFATDSVYADTWLYHDETWTKLETAGAAPAGREGHSLVYDISSGMTLLFGGWGEEEVLGDLWIYDSTDERWMSVYPDGDLPLARTSAGMVHDPVSNRLILFGGWDGYTTLGDMWSLAE